MCLHRKRGMVGRGKIPLSFCSSLSRLHIIQYIAITLKYSLCYSVISWKSETTRDFNWSLNNRWGNKTWDNKEYLRNKWKINSPSVVEARKQASVKEQSKRQNDEEKNIWQRWKLLNTHGGKCMFLKSLYSMLISSLCMLFLLPFVKK